MWYLSFITAAIASLYYYVFALEPHKIDALKQDPWNVYLMAQGGLALNILILPVFLILSCTLLSQLEYRNHTWKQVYVSPQPITNVFVSKFLVIQLMILQIFVLTIILTVLSLIAIQFFKLDINLFEHNLNWSAFFIFYGRIYITILAMCAFQFWLGLRFRNFIVPVVIGLCLWLSGMAMLEEYAWDHDDMYPFVYPMRNFFPTRPTDGTTILWGSVLYMTLFLVLGFIDFKRKQIKS